MFALDGALGRVLDAAQINDDGEEIEEAGNEIAAFGDPSHRFHAERMHGEDQRGEEGADGNVPAKIGGGFGDGAAQKGDGQEVEYYGVGGVPQQIDEVVAERIESPEVVIEAEGHPGDGDVAVEQVRGPHPVELLPAQAAVVRVVEKIDAVVPVHEVVAERGKERDEAEERDAEGEEAVEA